MEAFKNLFQDGLINQEFLTILVIIVAVCVLVGMDKEVPAIINMIIGIVGKGVYDKVKKGE